MGDRSQTARTEATVSRVIFAEAASRSSRGQRDSARLKVIFLQRTNRARKERSSPRGGEAEDCP